ncbi:hypothetical protein THRCLA_20325 [Thraustotheca clavata]|uniref:Uncharacterized protein n=1 Tax=Thraustotheca clavata TaxID=74557 RepID=A0A1W0A9G6_9STRA|nr:hypothetical protein THRCLA_20325 [Thraustotheca clavata]
MVLRKHQTSERSIKGWFKRLCCKKTSPHVSVIPLPEKYIQESSEMMFVGGKQVPFLPKQVAALKARSSWDELGRIDECKEGIVQKESPEISHERQVATYTMALQTAMF